MIYTFYLDFDGTCVEHDYPRMGRCNFGCIEVIRKIQDAGHDVFLNSYRADLSMDDLLKATNWFHWSERFSKNKNIELLPLTGVLNKKINPYMRWDWSEMKEEQTIFIDDITPLIPLKKAAMVNNMMVDWDALDKEFTANKIY